MNTFDEVTSNMETVLKKRPANDTTTGTNMSNTNMDENTNGDNFEGEKMVSLKHLKKAKIDRRSRGRSSNIHSRSGNSVVVRQTPVVKVANSSCGSRIHSSKLRVATSRILEE